ncbi:glycoside hydrolase family 2 protein [Bacteroides sp.]|uniref:beta-mannosidase n=1 Tax=Bacteroides sp. TaxID=29523 RepID=UPI0023CF9CA4|nr:glycoside hydrolase family 2 protein [Bacteroides sp.]MDE6216259.1 glycoside hydrolase family 2 protein [Bacteroides sp.]
MKRKLLYTLMACLSLWNVRANDTSEIVLLNQGWMFSQSGTDKWMTATVPGTVHQDLLAHQLLPNPFFGTNEQKIQWVENEDWEYKTTFTVTEEQLSRGAASLVFEGLDTYANVYLNGALLLKADNMFLGYSIPVKEVLHKGENRLHIFFRSPIKETLPQWASNGFDYPADNDHLDKKLSIFTRKAPYSYGWDWGIRMVTSGIWRPAYLRFYDVATIDDYHVKQLSLTDQRAEVSNELEINSILSEQTEAEVVVSYSLKNGEPVTKKKTVTLNPGINKIKIPVEVENPVRWMPNGWGEPTLYDFTAQVVCQGKTIASDHHRIGLRTIRLVNEKDEHGESYFFEVNGIPMFAKGANFIPNDILLPTMTDERYATLFRDIKEANMNVIRVWGGGTYEDNRFYDLADENGILIWQDFMFGCTTYPADPTFLKRVSDEVDYNIKRLRNHACLAMWCGNNEILEGLKYWGWQSRYTPEVYEEFYRNYDKLFRGLLPAKVKEWDEGRSYIHTSPYFSSWGRPDSWNIGDSHNWGIWYGKKTFESSDTEIGRFQSEFGFESFPEMKTIATFASPEDYEIESEVMTAHQKSTQGNALIRTYMERDFIVPEKFEDFVYVGLVLHGQGMRYCFEAHRRNRPYCMGTLYWQLNDSWPVVSWSSIDYYGNWKALHYQAKRAFAPLIINPIHENGNLNVYLLSDKLEDSSDMTLDMRLMDFKGKKLLQKSAKVAVAANTSAKVFGCALDEWADEAQRKECYLLLSLKDRQGKEITRDIHYFLPTKDLNLPQTTVNSKLKVQDGRCEVTLSASKLAKDIFVQIPYQGARFTDNFFDLLPGETRKIVITSPEIKKGITPEITIKHIRETY